MTIPALRLLCLEQSIACIPNSVGQALPDTLLMNNQWPVIPAVVTAVSVVQLFQGQHQSSMSFIYSLVVAWISRFQLLDRDGLANHHEQRDSAMHRGGSLA